MTFLRFLNLAAAVAFPACAPAEFLRIEQTFRGMDCASCVKAIESGVRRIRGVESVEVLGSEGLVKVTLAPGNNAGLDRVRDAIKATGYTPDTARVTVRGRIVEEADALRLAISGSTAHLVLRASGNVAAALRRPASESVLVEGAVNVPANPRELVILEVTAVREDVRR